MSLVKSMTKSKVPRIESANVIQIFGKIGGLSYILPIKHMPLSRKMMDNFDTDSQG